MIEKEVERRCLDCEVNISNRHPSTKRCVKCANARNARQGAEKYKRDIKDRRDRGDDPYFNPNCLACIARLKQKQEAAKRAQAAR